MDEQHKGINIFEETMAHMTYVQIEEAAREGTIVLFPTGVIEEHGPHLPLAVDVYGAYLQSRAVKSELERMGIKVMIAPPFYWGINTATGAFSGSFTCREETVIAVLTDAMANLKKWGFDRVFVLNHHMDGSHVQALDKAIRKAREEIGIQAHWIVDQFMAKRLGFKGDEPHLLLHKTLMDMEMTSPYLNIHAEAYETSLIWHYLPELINIEIWRELKPTNLTFKDLEIWRKGGMDARKVTPKGYFGDPTTARPEKGRKEIEAYGKIAAKVIEDFLMGCYSPPKESDNKS
ncbi:MAG TPA: creatininase family protein [Thermodesulfobacteriota bacterium]|nr:creatininase family protein [Thermodesulfobacteriota bacterium]